VRPLPTAPARDVSISQVTDAELVGRARLGDAAAFGELVDRHRSAVFRAALAALSSRADAEDAAQDAFVTAWRRLAGFRGDASFKTWLLTIAWHEAINHRRRATRWWRRVADEEHDVESAARSPEQTAVDAELDGALRAEIRTLPPKLRDALLLAQSGEHRYEEIAAMLDIPLGTVKWRVSEARRVVKVRLQARGYRDVG